jgi:hypothetical protein
MADSESYDSDHGKRLYFPNKSGINKIRTNPENPNKSGKSNRFSKIQKKS